MSVVLFHVNPQKTLLNCCVLSFIESINLFGVLEIH